VHLVGFIIRTSIVIFRGFQFQYLLSVNGIK